MIGARRETPEDRAHIPDEEYADAFAMALLMPEEAVRQEWGRSGGGTVGVIILAYRFGVSAEHMACRLRDLGLRP